MIDSNVFTLGDLLDQRPLGLELLVGSDAQRDRLVVGAHSIEVPDPAKWLDRDWVMLTTGIELPADDPSQHRLIVELDRAGITALGFGVGVTHATVPEGLRRAAEELDFPIFTVPIGTPFREVVISTQTNNASTEARTFNRLTALQRYLLAGLAETCPAACIIKRLATFIDVDAALVAKDGEALLGTCVADRADLADVLSSLPDHPLRIESNDRAAWLVPVARTERGAPTWLLVAARGASTEQGLVKAAAQMAAPLLEATTQLDELRNAEDCALRRSTMDALLDAAADEQFIAASARAGAWGLDVSGGLAVYVARTRRSVVVDPDELLIQVEASLAALDVPWLAAVRDGSVVVLGIADLDGDPIAAAMVNAHPQLLVGVGRAVAAPELIAQSHVDAELGIRQLAKAGRKRVLRYDDLDLMSVVVGEVSRDRLEARVDRWLQPVLDSELAYETLVAYLDSDLDVGRTSKVLNLHPNSTRYRLARIEQLLGSRLRRPSTIAALHFAMLLRNQTPTTGASLSAAVAV